MSDGRIIGTLQEGAIHSFVKDYVEPRRDKQEIEYLGYIADIKNENGIAEVQTSSFERLREKLAIFLEESELTLIHPIITEKQLVKLSEAGEVISLRKSLKHVRPIDACSELYKIRDFLSHPHLTVKILSLSAVEYRYDGKRESKKMKTRSVGNILAELILKAPSDYRELLLPVGISREFFAREYIEKTGLKSRSAYSALGVLLALGVIERGEKCGRAYIYKIKD